jgi:hypothetical protein
MPNVRSASNIEGFGESHRRLGTAATMAVARSAKVKGRTIP